MCPFSSYPGTQNKLQGKIFLPKRSLLNSALDIALLPLFLTPSSSKALCSSTAVSFPGSISTPALGSPDWNVLFPELMAQLWHGLAWPKLTGFCLSLQGGHMLTPLPAATPMKPGSAVSTCVLLPRSLSRALSVPWLGGCSLPEGGGTVVHMGS